MEYEQWLGILTSINADNDLNEINVIEKIKEKLEKEDPGTYKERQDNQFDINYTLLDSFGELEVRLYPDMRNKDLIRVEVRDQEMLKQLKDCEEKIGKNCFLGELPFNQAIEQGFLSGLEN